MKIKKSYQVRLDASLHHQLKIVAANQRLAIKDIIDSLVADYLKINKGSL